MSLFEDFEAHLKLGVPAMDRQHRELVELLERMDASSNAAFAYLFSDLVNHTRAHFATEEVMMRETGFLGTGEHRNEHTRILGEMQRFAERLRDGRIALARAYVREHLPSWFALHATTMDSALAAHIRGGVRTTSSTTTAPVQHAPAPSPAGPLHETRHGFGTPPPRQ